MLSRAQALRIANDILEMLALEAECKTCGSPSPSHVTAAPPRGIAHLNKDDSWHEGAAPEAPPPPKDDARAVLRAPCRWCGYNGPSYWQDGTHATDCPWWKIAGEVNRLAVMADHPRECIPLGASSSPQLGLREVSPIPLNEEQEAAAKLWAADDRLWTTQETVEFNLRTFARVILKALAAPEPLGEATGPQTPGCLGCGATMLVGFTIERRPGPFCRTCWEDVKHHVAEAALPVGSPDRPQEEISYAALRRENTELSMRLDELRAAVGQPALPDRKKNETTNDDRGRVRAGVSERDGDRSGNHGRDHHSSVDGWSQEP